MSAILNIIGVLMEDEELNPKGRAVIEKMRRDKVLSRLVERYKDNMPKSYMALRERIGRVYGWWINSAELMDELVKIVVGEKDAA